MSLKPSKLPTTRQRGNLLIVVFVIIIILLALGLAFVKVLSASAQQNVIEYYGTRAFMAAQSGLQVGLTELFPLNSDVQSCAQVTVSPSFTTPYLSNCEVTVSCAEYLEIPDSSSGSGSVNVYYLSSQAICTAKACAEGDCRSEFWQTQRTVNIEAKTLP